MDDLEIMLMAGGKGTRVRFVAPKLPKPMIPLAGKPVLQYQLEFFRSLGFHRVYISIGYLGQVVKEYFGDGSRFGIQVVYLEEKEPLGTAGAFRLMPKQHKMWLVVNGDLVLNFDIMRMLSFHKRKQADITLFTHPNQHPYDSALIDTDSDGRIIKWWNKEGERTDAPNCVNAGIHLINVETLCFNSKIWHKKKVDLDRDILKPSIRSKRIYAYNSPEYVKDMGTPERLKQVEIDIVTRIVAARNLKHLQRAIFMDRDGTINQALGYITSPDQIHLIAGVSEAIKRINQSVYLAFVVTNQPVIARGECTFEEMCRIHARLESLLGMDGAYLDGITFCPHHPDNGFPGEIKELKTVCQCRKPAPGMLLSLAEQYNISLSDSWVIGDSAADIEAGRAVNCHTVYLGADKEEISLADYHAENLYDAMRLIFE